MLTSYGEDVLQGANFLAGDDARLGTHGAREAGEYLGIDPVGLGKLAGGFIAICCQKGNSPTVISNMG